MLHRFRLIVLCTLIAGALGTTVARAARAPTASESRAIARAALRFVHQPGSRVSRIRVSTVASRYRYAKAMIRHGPRGPREEMILRSRPGGRWSMLFLGQSEFCSSQAPRAVLLDLGFACRYAPRLSVVPRTVVLEARVTLIGHGFRPRTSVWLGVGPPQSEATRVGSARTTPTGFFRKVLRVRRSWLRPSIQPGHYVALACQRGCRIKTGATFRIVSGRG